MPPLLTIALKDLRLLLRDRAALFFTVVFPVAFATIFGLIYAGMGGTTSALKIAVVDHADSPASRALIARLHENAAIDTVPAETDEQARDLVRSGRRSACLLIPTDFANLSSTLLSGIPATLELGIDPSRTQERAMIDGLVAQAAFEQLTAGFQDAASLRAFTADARTQLADAEQLTFIHRAAASTLLADLDRLADQMRAGAANAAAPAPAPTSGAIGNEPPDAAAQPALSGPPVAASSPAFTPISITTSEITGNRHDWHASAFSVTFAQGVVWALIGCAASFSMSLVIERAAGTLLRLRAAPLSPLHVIAAKALACIATTLSATVLLIALGTIAFGLRIGDPLMLAAALLASSIAFVGVMMVLSAIGRTPRAAGPLGYAILLTMAILGGGMMPRFMMPAWMQSVGMVSPVTWTVISVENAVFRGATWGEQSIPLLILLLIGAGGTALGAWLFSRTAG